MKTIYNIYMISGIFVKILSIVLLLAVGIVLILGIGTLFKGGEVSKKYSNKLMQLRVLLQFIAILVLIGFAYFFKN
ncbi:twin transmembrane helix small protein [Candidatus Pelagibacter sp.]|nr:twin transmembrane helix small protein [Candidatus Pelagibacter sp.]MDB3960177.1 twin transmembrane helix small protein [Candidatus Pelagibacter sp.]MDC0356191.1 twin transmembrane helix small protein [Candidatus Pelagibacter sp.]MDC0915844.1 twin transmembrane helix small protein [Candidatus Pelagibacter sp.]